MKRSFTFRSGMRPIQFVIAAVALQFLHSEANAAYPNYTLTDGNSTVNIDVASQTGMYNWIVDGQDQLNKQWFWFRAGNATKESSIDSITSITANQPTAGSLVTTYVSSQFSIQAVYSLVGGSALSGTSDLGEQIKIQNLTSAPLVFHFYQFADFTTGGNVQLGKNLQNLFNQALVTGGTASVSENLDSVVSPGANFGETALPPFTLNRLNDGLISVLNNSMTGTNGATWALEWDRTIAANGTLIISKDLNIEGVTPVPEPGVWSLISLGLIAFGAVKRHRNRG